MPVASPMQDASTGQVTVSVSALSGTTILGPTAVRLSEPSVTVRRAVAEALGLASHHDQAVVLWFGEVELSSKQTLGMAGITDGADLKAVVLSGSELAKRVLQSLLDQAVLENGIAAVPLPYEELEEKWKGADAAILVADLPKDAAGDNHPQLVPDVDAAAWLTSIANHCGCAEAGLPPAAEEWLEAIRASGKIFGTLAHSFVCTTRLGLKGSEGYGQLKSREGILRIVDSSREDCVSYHMVDLHGELAQLFGASAEQSKGVVWYFGYSSGWMDHILTLCPSHDWDDEFAMTWKTFIGVAREHLRADMLPHVVAPSLTSFFSRWAEDHAPPCEPTRDVPEVLDLVDTIKRTLRERKEQKLSTSLAEIFTLLDAGGKGHLACADVRPIGELLALIPTPLSDEEDFVPQVCSSLREEDIKAAWQKQFESGCDVELVRSAPLLGELIKKVQEAKVGNFDNEDLEATVDDLLKKLRRGAQPNGHYLTYSDVYMVAQKTMLPELFRTLDKDKDGLLSCQELLPFVELMGTSVAQSGYYGGSAPLLLQHEGLSEAELAEKWAEQFAAMCVQWGADVSGGFSEAAFVRYAKQVRSVQWEMNEWAWALECLRRGPPPGGHYLNINAYIETNKWVSWKLYDSETWAALLARLDTRSSSELYAWALQSTGTEPRWFEWTHPGGDVYRIRMNPTKQSLPDVPFSPRAGGFVHPFCPAVGERDAFPTEDWPVSAQDDS